ncbi:MAG: 50S ribosomal protein L1 [candidate division WWE3 bacterium GW2011_GWE2_43_18]|nr:MAG: 50S ribosomal protein L1 [candidate division WWE3 bacterium GW2011_GWB1_42_117]KKS54456.1 MAG: 50S ribosomal protein L1 [candidate division WWE3 bacterium GW2011_GWD2_42_34]KKT04636.1 MAG: 50S ribosomal protein L1 [candidate division WWE3 bacterium GW2011_GWE2_43_18]KKT06225.1 MAG: 50S ribosomal protein L1 [candidate division WWE3 bacterium GW2011_GWF2_43_18]KKT08059.1 MAG: 50S ribosomal protein L1 [candidate division WWE3 bacterium GW2011_GWD1_43_201]KKT10211.1 MAG: 50S ribosomal prot
MELMEAIKKAKLLSKEKFDATVEIHINLDLDSKKQDQPVRFSLTLPNGTGKTKKVAVLASKKVTGADLELKESDIELIQKGQIKPRIDFDTLVTEPAFMPKLAKVAKILGPAGVMPNPKTGTVTEDAEKAVSEIKKGRLDVKTEKDLPMIHTIIGKRSFTEKQLSENFMELYKTLKQSKPTKASPEWIKSIFISTSMGQSVKVDHANL